MTDCNSLWLRSMSLGIGGIGGSSPPCAISFHENAPFAGLGSTPRRSGVGGVLESADGPAFHVSGGWYDCGRLLPGVDRGVVSMLGRMMLLGRDLERLVR